MLMDILMESLLSMDDETLDYVLESCSAEELELIDDAMEMTNAKRIASNIVRGPDRTNSDLIDEEHKRLYKKVKTDENDRYNKEMDSYEKSNPDMKKISELRQTQKSNRAVIRDITNAIRKERASGQSTDFQTKRLRNNLAVHNDISSSLKSYPSSKKSPDNVADYNQGRSAIYDKHVKKRSDNLGVVIPRPESTSETRANDNSTSAKIGRTLRTNIPSPAIAAKKIGGKIGSAVDTIRTGKSRAVTES